MWISVENYEGAAEYVNLDSVVKVVFVVNAAAQQVDAARLYAIGGDGLTLLGTVRGDVSLRKLRELVENDTVLSTRPTAEQRT